MSKPRAIIPTEKVDLLAMELEQKLPYWLNPIVTQNDSPRVRAARSKRYREQWAKDHPRKKTSE